MAAWLLGLAAALLIYLPDPWRLIPPLLLIPSPRLLAGMQWKTSSISMTGLLAPMMLSAYAQCLPLLPPGVHSILLVVILPIALHLILSFLISLPISGDQRPLPWALAIILLDVLPSSAALGVFADPTTPSIFHFSSMWLFGPHTATMLCLLAGALPWSRGAPLAPLTVIAVASTWSPKQEHSGPTIFVGQSGNTRPRVVNNVPPQQQEEEQQVWHGMAVRAHGHLLFLPEGAVAQPHYAPNFPQPLPQNVIYGATEYTVLNAYNSVFQGGHLIYRKRHLVPITETTWLTRSNTALTATVITTQGRSWHFGFLTCVEGMFAQDAAQLARHGAQTLVVLASNKRPRTAWMQLVAAQSAARSSGLSLIVASEGGMSAIVTSTGQVEDVGPWGKAKLLSATLTASPLTFYARTSSWQAWWWCAALAGAALTSALPLGKRTKPTLFTFSPAVEGRQAFKIPRTPSPGTPPGRKVNMNGSDKENHA